MGKTKLGWTKNPVPQTKAGTKTIKKKVFGHRVSYDVPAAYVRDENWVAYVTYDEPKIEVWSLIQGHVKSAAVVGVAAAGGVGAITANPAAAFGAFKAAFVAHLQSLTAGAVAAAVLAQFVSSIELRVDSEVDKWHEV